MSVRSVKVLAQTIILELESDPQKVARMEEVTMAEKNDEWQSLRPALWRTAPGLGRDDEIDRKVREQGPAAFSYLMAFVEDDKAGSESRYRAMAWLVALYDRLDADGKGVVEALENLVRSNLNLPWSRPREDALMALGHLARDSRDDAGALEFLLQLAGDASLSTEASGDVLPALAATRSPKAVAPLALGILKGRRNLVQGLQEISPVPWTDKAETFIRLIEKQPIRSSEVDARAIVRALSPSQWEGEDTVRRLAAIGDYLIEKSRNRDERVAGILARLLIESEGGDQNQAGHRINEYQKNHEIPANELDGLRKTVGGAPALSGIMGVLQKDLETYFQKPIHELNEKTRTSWDKTVTAAHYGLVMRLWMSGTVFVVGILLLVVSCARMLIGDDSNGLDTQTLVPFLSGLGTTLLIIYTGPLKEIRQAVTDLATANAAFIGYVHQVLEASHTFSFYYLHERISFEHTEKSSAIIKEAMINTVNELDRVARDSSEQTILKAVKRGEAARSGVDETGSATAEHPIGQGGR